MKHTCHAEGCNVEVPPKTLMCINHWRRVPRGLQTLVWATYRPGQENDKVVTRDYLTVQRTACAAVAVAEGKLDVAHACMNEARAWSKHATPELMHSLRAAIRGTPLETL